MDAAKCDRLQVRCGPHSPRPGTCLGLGPAPRGRSTAAQLASEDPAGMHQQPDPAGVLPRPSADLQLACAANSSSTGWRAQATAAALSSHLASAAVDARQACFRPLSQDGVPVIGAVPGTPGAFIATGHSCWCACCVHAQGALCRGPCTCRPTTRRELLCTCPAALCAQGHPEQLGNGGGPRQPHCYRQQPACRTGAL